MTRTNLCALAAGNTLILVNMGEETVYMNSIMLASLLALVAANTANLADTHNVLALVVVVTANCMAMIVWNQLNQVVWTGGNTLAAGLAGLLVYQRNAINNMDCIKWAGLYAGAKAHTAIAAGLRTTAWDKCHRCTLIDTGVLVHLLCILASAMTLYKGYLADALLCSDTHDL